MVRPRVFAVFDDQLEPRRALNRQIGWLGTMHTCSAFPFARYYPYRYFCSVGGLLSYGHPTVDAQGQTAKYRTAQVSCGLPPTADIGFQM
jgi:hypothetical protein